LVTKKCLGRVVGEKTGPSKGEVGKKKAPHIKPLLSNEACPWEHGVLKEGDGWGKGQRTKGRQA